ncbi:MAG: hypothetical protein ACJ797_18070 [Ktedonobacteraceae bacterium]
MLISCSAEAERSGTDDSFNACLTLFISRRVDDDIAVYRLATVFIVLGATLYFGPLVFAVESASQPYLAGFGQFFTSNTNVPVALGIMWVSLAGVVAVAGWLFIRSWMSATRSMAKRMTPTETTPAPTPKPTPEPVPVV